MPYLSIVQAAEATGKSQKTIRRLVSKPESQLFVTREGEGPNASVQIDSSYLASVYPMSIQEEGIDTPEKEPRQGLDTGSQSNQAQPSETERDYIAFLKEELKRRDEQLAAKERRIEDLTEKLTSIKLLTEGKPAEEPKKKKWWPW